MAQVPGVALPGVVEDRNRDIPLAQHGQHLRHRIALEPHTVHDLAGRGGRSGGLVALTWPCCPAEGELRLAAEASRDPHPDRARAAAATGVAPALRRDRRDICARGLAGIDEGADQ